MCRVAGWVEYNTKKEIMKGLIILKWFVFTFKNTWNFWLFSFKLLLSILFIWYIRNKWVEIVIVWSIQTIMLLFIKCISRSICVGLLPSRISNCRDFRHEKTKKNRGSYTGGLIDLQSHSVKFSYSDEEWYLRSMALTWLSLTWISNLSCVLPNDTKVAL